MPNSEAPSSETSAGSLLAKVGRGVSALALGSAITMIGQLIVIPVTMRTWGPARWGEWIVLTGSVSLLATSDLGLQSFVVNRVCSAYARDERSHMIRTLQSALKIQLPLVLGIIGALIAVLPWLHVGSLLGLKTIGGSRLVALLLLLACEPLLAVPMGVIAGVYRATGRLARGAMAGNCRQLALLIATVLLVWGGGGFVLLGSIRVLLAMAVAIWILIDLRRLYPWLSLWPGPGSMSDGLGMVVPGIFFLLIPVTAYLGNEFILMIVQRSLGGWAVSRFSTHQTAVNFSRMVSNALAFAVWPELTMLYARAELRRLRSVHVMFVKWNLYLIGVVGLATWSFLPAIYTLWTGKLTLDRWTLIFMLARLAFWGGWSGSMTLLLAIDKQRSVSIALAIAAFIGSVGALVLVPHMGIAGAALALFVGDLCGPAWLMPLLAVQETDQPISRLLRDAYAVPCITLSVVALVFALGWSWITSPVYRYLVVTPIAGLLGAWIAWLQATEPERDIVFQIARRLSATRVSHDPESISQAASGS